MQVQGTVLYTNDDYFALQDFDETLPNYYHKTCGEYRSEDARYMRMYKNCPPGWLNFDIHTPMIIDTTIYEWHIERPIKTYYANTHGLKGTVLPDCKIVGNRTYEEISAKITGRPFFSTKENAKLPGVARVLKQLYPEPSQYE